MRERALVIGAKLDIATREPSGVRVTLRVPLEGAS
jgi:signal transduction histidine kinase